MTESLRFSAKVSMAASRTSVALSCVVSRLTSRDSRARPAGSDSVSAASTAMTSSASMRQASRGLSSRPSTAAAATSRSGESPGLSPISSQPCSQSAMNPTAAAPRSHASAPAMKPAAGGNRVSRNRPR